MLSLNESAVGMTLGPPIGEKTADVASSPMPTIQSMSCSLAAGGQSRLKPAEPNFGPPR